MSSKASALAALAKLKAAKKDGGGVSKLVEVSHPRGMAGPTAAVCFDSRQHPPCVIKQSSTCT